MPTIGHDITKFNMHVKDLLRQLTARGETTQDLLVNLFKGYAATSDQAFVRYIEKKEEEYDDGYNITSNELMQLASNKFKVLTENGKWNAPSKEEQKIIALEAKFSKWYSKKKSSKERDNVKTSNSKRKPKPTWMTTKPDDISETKEMNGKTYYWCERHNVYALHKPQDCYDLKGKAPDRKVRIKDERKPELISSTATMEEDEDYDSSSTSSNEYQLNTTS